MTDRSGIFSAWAELQDQYVHRWISLIRKCNVNLTDHKQLNGTTIKSNSEKPTNGNYDTNVILLLFRGQVGETFRFFMCVYVCVLDLVC